ncbi:MAG: hypothetical protein BGO57_13345 [Sphingomonadales bacterium 63-6]|nr:MAG: hypothetical protein BGO57_13345 [Sphingomonadales bacterium 63-6]
MSAPAGPAPFSARAVLGLLVFGALAFIAALWFMGSGQFDQKGNDGGGHAAGDGLNGYSALAELLEKRGHEVNTIRNAANLDPEGLLILTPPAHADVEEINRIITKHRYTGPTLLILPKWQAVKLPRNPTIKAKDGWVALLGAGSPEWAGEVGGKGLLTATLNNATRSEPGWSGLGLSGRFPQPGAVQTMTSRAVVPLVKDLHLRALAGFWNDGGYYPDLANAAGVEAIENGGQAENLWPVVIVAEPDLLDNYGLADRNRAMLALAIVSATLEDYDLPISFDLTLNGLGAGPNLLALAFSPPFLAATLCFLIAAIVVAWRGMKRFGPPLAALPVFAFGKRQLATNGAALIQRSRRLYLLGAPYSAILRGKVAHLLGIRPGGDPALTESEIDRLLERRGIEPANFSTHAEALRAARTPHDLLRHAHALKTIERKLAR